MYTSPTPPFAVRTSRSSPPTLLRFSRLCQPHKKLLRVPRVHKLLKLLHLAPILAELEHQCILIAIRPNHRVRRARRVHHARARFDVVDFGVYCGLPGCVSSFASRGEGIVRRGETEDQVRTVKFENHGMMTPKRSRYSSLFWTGRPRDLGRTWDWQDGARKAMMRSRSQAL
jgi:hypothetical protein